MSAVRCARDVFTLRGQEAQELGGKSPHVCSRERVNSNDGFNGFTRVQSAGHIRAARSKQEYHDSTAGNLSYNEDSESTASTQCASCGEWRRKQEQEELQRLRKEAKEMEEELENKGFTVETIQRNLQNVCQLLAADHQELMMLRRKESSGVNIGKLKKSLRESEESRHALILEVEKLRNNNLLLQQKVCRLREGRLVDERMGASMDVT